jgi:tol-pal system protein YbgF
MRTSLRPPRLAAPLLAVALAALSALPASAFLSDDEARKAIIDLRGRVAASDDATRARLAELADKAAATERANAQLLEQVAALRKSLLDLNGQLEALRGDLARLRGADEQFARDLSELQRRQRDVGQVLDDRLRRIEPIRVTVDGRDVMVDPEEKRQFEEAVATIRGGNFDAAVGALAHFQRRWPGSPYLDQARFWQANALYGRRDYKEAIVAYRSFVTAAPEHPRAPEALLALANSQAEMKDPRAARRTIEELMKAYPQSEAAQAGKERLASLR